MNTILMLIDQLNVGGTETHVLSLTKQLIQEGVKVVIGTSGGPLLDTFESSGLEVAYLPFQSDDPIGEEYQALLKKTKELVKEKGVDLLHAHSIAGLKVAVQVGQELLVPTIATIHGKFYPPRKLRGLLDRCSQVIAVSVPVLDWLTQKVDYPLNQITLIPNGVETEYFKPGERLNRFREELELNPEDMLAVVVSRLAWEKTRVVEAAIQATIQLQDEFPLHLAIIGSGAHTPLIHAAALLANRTANKDVVNVLGWRINTLECYQGADLIIGTARVALEALSCGKPVIAGGNASYFGYLEPNNIQKAWDVYFGDHQWAHPLTIAGLKSDLRHVLSSQVEFTQNASKLREWVMGSFDIKKITEKTLELYRGVIVGNPNWQSTSTSISPAVEFETQPNTKADAPIATHPVPDPELSSKRPLISVAIPAYNRGAYLQECLQGVVAQTYRPLEIIVVNDGSTDNTEEVALEWWETVENSDGLSFVYLKLPHNTGYASAQSIAYQISTGEYIANQDSDDTSHPSRLEQELFFLQTNTDYSFVGSNFRSFQGDLTKTKKSHMLRYGYEAILNTYRDGGHCICFGTLLFKRSILERIGGLTSFLRGAEDYEWITRALNQGFYVDNLSQELYFYREHEDQLSRTHLGIRRQLQTGGRSAKS
ncbi:MAG: glycosyltransferase [Firmicutes bacterium]|nr:glycosyltransferase [Bacillota bacterium]